ncbi:MAG TPA: S-layer homology domain-containing protein [Thermoanaerobaculia bacterium]
MRRRPFLLLIVLPATLLAGGAARIVQDQCGPFTDVTPAFCPYVLELYYLGVTAGTSATTFSPDDPLTRGQGAVFVAKGVNQALARSSRRAALGQWWTTTPHWDLGLGVTQVQNDPEGVASDGQDIWVANEGDGTVSRVRASDGRLLDTWTNAHGADNVLAAMGRIFVSGIDTPNGRLYMIDPSQASGGATIVAADLPASPFGLTFDGSRIWTANVDGSVSIITPSSSPPWPVTSVSTGFVEPVGALFDGQSVWVTDFAANSLLRLDSAGAVLQTVATGAGPSLPTFDGANIWVPNDTDASVTVVRVADGAIITTLTGNGLQAPFAAAFDGERILVVNGPISRPGHGALSLFRAADLAPLGNFVADGFAACSDGTNFWVSLQGTGQLARF